MNKGSPNKRKGMYFMLFLFYHFSKTLIFPGMLASAVYIAKILLCYAYLRLFQTSSKGGKYSGLNNAAICKVYQQSMSDAKKEKGRLRKQQLRAALKIYMKHLESDSLRKQH